MSTSIPVEEWASPFTIREGLHPTPSSPLDLGDGVASAVPAPPANDPKQKLLPFKIVMLAICLGAFLGWVGIIVMLIALEEWQLVMVAWLLFYAAGHFSVWYFNRLLRTTDPAMTLRQRFMARLHGESVRRPSPDPDTLDKPPSYEDLVKAELPPPSYYAVVRETPKVARLFGSLPWFLRKKTLETQQQEASTNTSSDVISCKAVDASKDDASYDYRNDEVWKASGGGGPRSDSIVVANISLTSLSGDDGVSEDDVRAGLPSYEEMMTGLREPVMTPIHRALASLPKTPSLPTLVEAEPKVEVEESNTELQSSD